jgi:hypothetical protein
MARSAFHQSSFLGGEWSPTAQGRSDLPMYRAAMNVCMNGMPVEEGAWTRRSGTQFIASTRNKGYAKLLPFHATNSSYLLEFTDNSLRMYQGTSPLFTTVHSTVTASSLSAQLLTVTLTSGTGFLAGDDVMLWSPTTLDFAAIGPFRNRVMKVTTVSGNDITMGDETGAAFGAGVTSGANVLATCVLYQIMRFNTPWTGNTTLRSLRGVQANDGGTTNSIILSSTSQPYELQATTAAAMSLAAFTLEDGPYLDAQPDTGTVNGYSGTITFTPTSSTFAATDISRNIRLFSQPAAWLVGTTYAQGDNVTYQNAYWKSAVAGNVGVIPGTLNTSNVMVWLPAPQAGSWAWGYITAQTTSVATVAISPLSAALQSANGTTITTWHLGVYKSGQYPTCGVYFGGRLYLGGAIANRFDASSSNDPNNFSPTDQFGTVMDNNAISATLNSDDLNDIRWMAADHQGLLMGTSSGEWLIRSSNLDDPITPTSIQAHRVTNYGVAAVEPHRAGMSLVFVQRYGQRILEYLADTLSGRFTGKHLNEVAKHITAAGAVEMAYQEEKAPVLWVLMTDGSLAGCTYRRISRFVTENPVFQGWHRQVISSGYAGALVRLATSIVVLPNDDGLSDMLYIASTDTSGLNGAVEVLRPLYEDV